MALVNGINYSWGNISVVLMGVPLVGITKISFNEKQAKENIYGVGTQPISRGHGNSEYEASITLLYDEVVRIKAAAPNNRILDIGPFEITVLWGGNRVAPIKTILQMAEFMEDPFEASQGDTKHEITIPLVIGGFKSSI